MPDHTYLGIDPGKNGGIASIHCGVAAAAPMPATERDVWNLLLSCIPQAQSVRTGNITAVIEKVGGFVGGNPLPGSAMFNFGASYGGLRMALIAAGIPFIEVTPQRWQKALGIPPRKKTESKTAWKNRLKALAQQQFPKVDVTLKTADALLIALYCSLGPLNRSDE